MIRPKGADVDAAEGYLKYKLKRWFRVWLKKQTRLEIKQEQNERLVR
jgi:hypothetical protein